MDSDCVENEMLLRSYCNHIVLQVYSDWGRRKGGDMPRPPHRHPLPPLPSPSRSSYERAPRQKTGEEDEEDEATKHERGE